MRFLKNKGFTLLELLVVISIIGILVAMGAVAYSVAQKKGRDARRVGDMKSIQNAFEQYYATNSSVYSATCNTMISGGLVIMPTDPKTSSAYSQSCTTSSYCVCADVEDDKGNSNAPANASCTGIGAGTTYFCVKNLQ